MISDFGNTPTHNGKEAGKLRGKREDSIRKEESTFLYYS